MKRSPLKRKSALKANSPLKRSRKRIRRVSKKRQRLRKQVKPDEDAFLEEFPACFYCGSTREVRIDHIVSGTGGRPVALSHRAAWNAACWRCNSGKWAGSGDKMFARKLAVKRKHDPAWYDLELCCRLRGKWIEQGEVDDEGHFD